jgi:hypothetical protein
MSQGPRSSAAAADPRRIALWGVPRSISTAFERVFVERPDAAVLHEPFSHAYYHGPDRLSDRFGDVAPRPEHAYEAVAAEVTAPCEAPILFMKDMAYQARPIEDPAFYAGFINTFLIREPAEALLSLHRMWPDFTLQEAGFVEQAALFDLVTETLEQPAVVVDATDFRSAPEEVMAAYCDAVEIPHREDALSWQPGPVDLWQGWSDWHRGAEQSAGIAPPAPAPAPALPPRVAAMVDVCQPHYERLHAARLRP